LPGARRGDLVLAREIAIDVRRRHAAVGGDLAHRRLGEAVADEAFLGGALDAAADVFTAGFVAAARGAEPGAGFRCHAAMLRPEP
jgi:hypothetical protein